MPTSRAVIPAQLFIPGKSNPAIRVGFGDRVAVLGAFPTISKTVVSVSSYSDAMELLNIKTGINDKYHTNNAQRNESQLNPTLDYFDGARALKHLFRVGSADNNVGEAIIINTSTDSTVCASNDNTIKLLNGTLEFGNVENSADATSRTQNGQTLTKLDYALERLKEEEYDILLLAFTPTAAQVTKLIEFCKNEYRRSNPIGIVYGYGTTPRPIVKPDENSSVVQTVINSTKSASITAEEITAIKQQLKLFEDATVEENHHHTLYALIPQSFKLTYENEYLSPMESAAYYCGVLASTRVDESMTDDVIPNVEAVNEDLVYDKSSVMGGSTDGYDLVSKGCTMFKKTGRATGQVVCINSTLPGKNDRIYDISHIRTAAYVIRKLNLREFFGEHENRVTLDAALTKLTTIQANLVNEFSDILYNISYSLQPHDNNCLDVYVQIECYDVLLQEEIYVNEVILPWQI